MESERDALRDIDTLRDRIAVMPRGHAVLQLAFTVLIAAYMGVFAFTGSIEGGASVFDGMTMTLMLPPIIISSGLISGANERFRARQRTTVRQWVAIGVFLVILAVLMVWGIAGNGYPWWVALVVAGGTLILFGAGPARVLARTNAAALPREQPHALPRSARITTVLIGVFLGLACAFVLLPAAALPVNMLGLIGIIVAVSAMRSPWGLMATGYAWRVAQWLGLAFAVAVIFALAVLIIATNLVTPAVAVCAGVIVAASVVISAFVPGRSHGAPAA